MRFRSVPAAVALLLSSCSCGVVFRSVGAASPSNESSNPSFVPEKKVVTWETPDSPYASYLGSLMSAARPAPDSSQTRHRRLEGDGGGGGGEEIHLT